MTSPATPRSTSSPEPASGPSPLDSVGGLTSDRSGARAAPVSRSRRPAKASASMIQGICGQTWIDSSVEPVSEDSDPLSLWESRLRERLATIGSTECALIWRSKDTGLGWSISRLAPWTPPTSASGSTGAQWATPRAEAARALGNPKHLGGRRGAGNIEDQMQAASGHQASTWSTPRASDGEKGGPNQSFGAGGQPLPSQMHQASPWVTPSAPHGPAPNGSYATTAKRGAPNPDFAFWLMGWPVEFRRGVLAAIASLPSSRRKPSPPSAKSLTAEWMLA